MHGKMVRVPYMPCKFQLGACCTNRNLWYFSTYKIMESDQLGTESCFVKLLTKLSPALETAPEATPPRPTVKVVI